jgi:C2H2-type zinc finger
MSSPIEKSGDDVKRSTKRKRTQRHCNINMISKPPPPAPVMTSSTSSSVEFSGITTEEEEIDLANSLILLSRGGNLIDRAAGMQSDTPTSPPPSIKREEVVEKIENIDMVIPSHQLVEAAAQSNGNDYTCKTCNKRFNSFQALGGHRASHKKPKISADEQKVQSSTDTGTTSGTVLKLDDITNYKDEIKVNLPVEIPPAVHATGSKERAHVCQICSTSFNSGQALGGHMRRHKPLNGGGDASRNKKERGGLVLDLNFPPLEQVDTRQKLSAVFPIEGSPQTQLFLGSSALTNCLY